MKSTLLKRLTSSKITANWIFWQNVLSYTAVESILLYTRNRKYSTVYYSILKKWLESILLYRAERWTITNKLEARLDDCYTRLLMMVLDLNWKDHPTREEIYGSLPKVSEVVRERRFNIGAHCSRRQNEPVLN